MVLRGLRLPLHSQQVVRLALLTPVVLPSYGRTYESAADHSGHPEITVAPATRQAGALEVE